jgi:hypothetical protein
LVVLGYTSLPPLSVPGAIGFADPDVVDSRNFSVFPVVHSGDTYPFGYSDTVSAAIVSAPMFHRNFVQIHRTILTAKTQTIWFSY